MPQNTRREFLATAAATAFTIASSAHVRAADSNSRIEVGLIGCGGRGSWIGELFNESSQAKIVAVADYFKDRVDETGEKLNVTAARRYTGLDCYKKLLEGKIDAVAIESPPYFHPEQAVAALEAGKHVYLAKPISVDVPGAMAIVNAAEKVKEKQSILVDFQTRADEFYQGAFQKITEGLIGEPICGQSYYHAGRLDPKAKGDSQLARLRNWVFDKALSGDIIVEQNIHVLDVANWFLRGHPVKAYGTGGRRVRVDVGDCWDNFNVIFTYPNDVIVDFSSTQFLYGFGDLCTRIYGSKGTADTHYGGQVNIRAKTGGYRGGVTSQIYKTGAVANINNFCQSIVSKKYVNNAQESANSTITCILGRTAAYEGRMVTWDEIMKANARIDPKLDLPANGPDWQG
ncbi:MAG TPA: Gfo/Idh/MocA family oxidoreductase [Tepidisphaeraceae bacterium]|jgi:predicted dehydrogenase|nr:Gfo/Idh/MocA family oxidoreductase [Tepidisphaeraceae bacterium]HEV8605503.1 Gfo/Idh/MocA family oxidoreductase [Tepidisphaeraceae bacterium]